MFRVGDIVEWQRYEGEWDGPYKIERAYNDLVFRIVDAGDTDVFVDLVPESCLRPIPTPSENKS